MASRNDKSNTDSLKESVLMNLRSVTQSRKGGVPLNCLERDYKDLLGISIPFKELGYTSLQAFLRDVPDVISLRKIDGQFIAEGVADSSTAHIVSLVNRQKTNRPTSKPSRRSHYIHRRGGLSSRYNSYSSSRPAPKNFLQRVPPSPPPSYQDSRHSKPPQIIPRPKSPKPTSPTEPRAQQIPARKYEVAPRFLRLQKQQNQVREPEQRVPREEQPDPCGQNYISEPYSNNHIRSPRPLLTSKSVSRSTELDSATTSKEYIEIYAKMNNLTPIYKTSSAGQKNPYYISRLTIGDMSYSSYYSSTIQTPKTPGQAEEIAAKLCCDAIQKSREHLASCLETPIRNAEDVKILLYRVEEIVCEKPSGMFTNGIINEYENKYNETLPINWLELLQQSSIVEIEALDVPYGRLPEAVKYIIRPAKSSSGSTTPSSTSELEKAEYVHEDSTLRNIVRKDQLPAIPELLIPFGNEWAVYIVDVSKTIAVRLFDYDNEFLNMSEEMKSFYKSEYLPAVEICEGLLYATCDADSDVFHRVLVQKIKDGDMVECYFVDEGMIAEVLKSDLQELSSDFWKLPYQAIHMTLDGLEDYEYFLTPDDLKGLLGCTLVALVKRWSTPITDFFPDDPAVHKIIYSVVLYDTRDTEDINMNDIIKKIVLESLILKLPKLSTSSRGFLTHTKNTGEIYLRFLNPHGSWLEAELEKLASIFEVNCLQTATVLHEKMYVAKYENGKWYRAHLEQISGSTNSPMMAEMFFIDYGCSSMISIKEICELEPHSEFLASLGAQAIKCELFNPLPSPDSKWTPAAISKLMELAPIDEELIVRVIDEGDDYTLPKVNLHKRTYQNGDSFIISINESLAIKPELFRTTSSNTFNSTPRSSSFKLNFQSTIAPPMPRTVLSNFNNTTPVEESLPLAIKPPSPANECLKWVTTPDNIKSPDALENHDISPLILPKVPDRGEQFDVFVTMAAHPHNFYVQPYDTSKEMNDLMVQMNHFYSSEEDLIEMHLSLLKENGFYAVKHKDGNWYRARLQSVLSSDVVVVMYVDFGDVVNVSLQQLQSLYSQFRHLPCQAIKASLSGVKPIEGDWTPMECVEFQNMVKEKRFVSIVQKKRIMENNDFPVLELELTLIDVSDPKDDIYIHEFLIEKGMARKV